MDVPVGRPRRDTAENPCTKVQVEVSRAPRAAMRTISRPQRRRLLAQSNPLRMCATCASVAQLLSNRLRTVRAPQVARGREHAN
jgi:hypothetical protein